MLSFLSSVSIEEWLALLYGFHAFALAVVNLTPTPKDNEVLAKYYRVIEVMAGLFTKRTKS